MVFEPRTETDAPAFFDTFGMLQHGLRCYQVQDIPSADRPGGLLGVLGLTRCTGRTGSRVQGRWRDRRGRRWTRSSLVPSVDRANGSRSRSRTRRRVESVRSTDGPPLLVPSRKDSMSIHNLRAVTKLEAQLTDAGASAHRPCVPPLQARPPRWQPPRPPLAARPPLLAPHAVEGGSRRHS